MNPLHFVSPHELKVATASAVAIVAAVGEAVGEWAGYESVSLKLALILAVGYLANELRRQRDKYEAEASKREERMATALQGAKDAMEELKTATETQTSYFKTVAQQIINASVHPNLPE